MQASGPGLQSPLADHSGAPTWLLLPSRGPKPWAPLPHGDKLQVPAEHPTWRQDTAESPGPEAAGPSSPPSPSLLGEAPEC